MITLYVFDLDVSAVFLIYNLTFLNFKKAVCSGKLFKSENPIICGFFKKNSAFFMKFLACTPPSVLLEQLTISAPPSCSVFTTLSGIFSVVWSPVVKKESG